MTYVRCLAALCSILFLLPGSLAAQSGPLAELEKFALDELRETRTPGAVIVVVSFDRAVLVKGLGVANIETGAPMTADTLFRIDVLSKFIASTCLVSLADEGKIDLQAPIGNYVKGLGAKTAAVTAHQLLTQTAGIREDHVEYFSDVPVGPIVRAWNNDSFFAEPGQIHSYSNPGFAPVRLLIDELAGKPFSEVARERVFDPLGMKHTTSDPMVAVTYPFTQSHTRANGELKVIRPFPAGSVGWPGSLMYSSANDIARFLLAIVNGGKIDDRQVFAPSVMAKLSVPHAAYSGAAGEQEGYGIHFSTYGGHPAMGTGTSWAGVTGYLRIVPDKHFALLILANGGRPLRNTAEKAMQMFIGIPMPTASGTGPVKAWSISESEAASLAGTYENERSVNLFVKEGRLFMREAATPQVSSLAGGYGNELPVNRVGDQTFTVTPAGSPIAVPFTVVRGKDGKVEYIFMGGRALKRK